MAEETPKPITSDPEEVELLTSLGIPLTDPNAKKDVDETHVEPAPEAKEEPKDEPKDDDKPADPPAEEVPADDGGGKGGEAGTAPAGGGPDGDADVPADPPAKPATTVKAEPVLSDAAKRLAEVEAMILADDHDPYSADGKKLQLEHNRLAAKVEAEPLYAEKRVAESYKPYVEQYPDIPQAKMQEVFAKHAKAYSTRMSGDALNAAATVAMEMELQQIANGQKGAAVAAAKPGAKVAPPVAKTPITGKGAIVAPPKTAPVSAPRKELSDEDELVATMRKNHPQGMRATLKG